MVVEKWLIARPIEGLPFRLEQNLKLDDVEIRMLRSNIDGKDKPMALTIVEAESEMIRIKAVENIDKAMVKLTFAFGGPIIPGKEVYFTQLEPESSRPKYDWGWHSCSTEGKAYAVVDYDAILEKTQSQIANLKPGKKEVFFRAASLYRAARIVNESLPTVSLILYFSSITALTRDTSGRPISTNELKQKLRSAVHNIDEKQFTELFDQMYRNVSGRSAVDHGWVDITDALTIGNATVLTSGLKHWTRALIQQYLEENQSLIQQDDNHLLGLSCYRY